MAKLTGRTQVGEEGIQISCPHCHGISGVYHLKWHELMCNFCRKDVKRNDYDLVKRNDYNDFIIGSKAELKEYLVEDRKVSAKCVDALLSYLGYVGFLPYDEWNKDYLMIEPNSIGAKGVPLKTLCKLALAFKRTRGEPQTPLKA